MTFSEPRLLPPTKCDNCNSNRVGLTSNSVIYGEEKGKWPYVYYCDDCTAVVACHPNTYDPMGYMAPSKIRRLRARLHKLLDPIWKLNYLNRSDAYDWLARQLSLADRTCHISQLTQLQLETAIELLTPHNKNEYVQFERRKLKDNKRKGERRKRKNSKIILRKYDE